ncbi:MAG: hypothetical protein H0T73_15565, partial [Ardenticatenales bacterium]|nr:hypothetical protein [Ardenticatenales bacterium]
MENTPRLYDTLVTVLSQHEKWEAVRHLKTLAWRVVGLILSGEIHLSEWGPPFTETGVWGRRDPTAYMEEVTFGGVGIRSLEPEEPI